MRLEPEIDPVKVVVSKSFDGDIVKVIETNFFVEQSSAKRKDSKN
jgi:hypothetical protein